MGSAVLTQTQPTLGTIWRAVVEGLQKNLAQAIGMAVIGGILGYAVNVYMMGWVYDGYGKTVGGAATGEGNMIQGSLLYAVGSILVFGIIGYRRAVGGPK